MLKEKNVKLNSDFFIGVHSRSPTASGDIRSNASFSNVLSLILNLAFTFGVFY